MEDECCKLWHSAVKRVEADLDVLAGRTVPYGNRLKIREFLEKSSGLALPV